MAENTENIGRYAFSNFVLDEAAGELYFGEEPLKLAPKVFQCLTYFVKNHDRLISKDELITEVWNEAFVEDNAVTYTVSQLRKVLATASPDTVFVETVPRRGFKFKPAVIYTNGIDADHLIAPEPETAPIASPPTETSSLANEGANGRSRPWVAIAAAATLIAIIGGLLLLPGFSGSSAAGSKVLAVLPLDDISDNAIDRSLLLGITYATISQLGRNNDLIVRPLSSVISSTPDGRDPVDAGRRIGADAVVEWNIQRSGDYYRVNARLLNVSDGKQMWQESADYPASDIFSIQESVAEKTARSLIANLSEDTARSIHHRGTKNDLAYQAYLRGRYHWNLRTQQGLTAAKGFFEQAISLDPKFAEAHTGLADAYLGLYDYGYMSAADTIPKAQAAVTRALQLNADLSEAYSALASIEFLHNHNWKATEENFLKAIELAPNDSTPKLRYGWMLSVVGKLEEGMKQLLAAEKIDPTSRVIQANIAENLIFAGRIDEAEKRLAPLRVTAPDFSLVYWHFGTIDFLRGNSESSLENYLKAFELDDGSPELVNRVRETVKAGATVKAFNIWRSELERRYQEKYFPPSVIALVAALAKDRDNTMKWLSEARRLNDPWILQIYSGPEFKFLYDDADFVEMRRSLELDIK